MTRTTLVALAAALALTACGGSGSSKALPSTTRPSANHAGGVRAVITFIGDSNIVFGATAITSALTSRDNPYALVTLARPGLAIRSSDCPTATFFSCTDGEFWKHRLAEALPRIKSDGFVVDLGVNDTAAPGTATTAGYADYGEKIDWLLALLPKATPVWWSDLPCTIEPPARAVGCRAVNLALRRARARWSNLTVLPWSSHADGHPTFMRPATGGIPPVHYSDTGDRAWAAMVVRALDVQFR